ncbi:RNA helicase [Linnemannia gamsii]|uniref:RNA helicase n=1 Tax=Linnemannia gamsii TaxID=64522 RepID=A0ABQ7K4W9_9FUNG|nr:RNA helicase [Linnemannia gamsii]
MATTTTTTTTTASSLRSVFCRFRHTESTSRFKEFGGHTSSRRSSPSFRDNEGSFRSRRYQENAFGGLEFQGPWETIALKNAIERFKFPSGMQQYLEAMGTPQETAVDLIKAFSRRALQGKVSEVNKKAIGTLADQSLEVGMTFQSMGITREDAIAGKLDKVIWDAFFTHCEKMFPPDTLFRLTRLREISDLRYPAEWNPAARLMKRKIIMHVGPTNSGKTYNALQRLQTAESGAYLSPLRLLAHEVFERMNEAGTPCNLITGEERRFAVTDSEGNPDPKAAKCVSCTVEMVDLNRKIEVAVVDEIQMLADPDRGWAWTHALLSLPAKEIHLCGEPTVVDLVKNICALMNEEVEVHRYDRLSKMEVMDESLYGQLDKIQKGDCVVTFSRKNIFLLKKHIEASTGLRCAVAYGSLPPESRSTQAKLFNDPNSGYDILVASDAIGMGLNLNIRRIIFEATEKFDGSVVRTLSLTQLKQIGGRAGRFGTEYAVGLATTLLQRDIPTLKRAMAAPMIDIKRAGIQPTADMLQQFSIQMPGAPFSYVLKTFEMMSRNSGLFFLGLFRGMIAAAEILDNIKMPVRERIVFISAPIQVRDPTVVEAAVKMAQSVSNGNPLSIDEAVQLPSLSVLEKNARLDLRKLESSHRTIMLYLWLSQRFGDVFQGGLESDAAKRKVQCETLIEKALEQADDARLKKRQRREAEKTKSDSIGGDNNVEKEFEDEEEVETKGHRPRRSTVYRR